MRILIVDDHPLFREVLGVHLQECFPDATVLEVGSVPEAVAVISEYSEFALILLDVSLPDVDGLSGLIAIRTQVLNTPIVMISGIGDSQIAHSALESGANGFISKATGGREIRNALLMVLQGETYISPCILVKPTESSSIPPPSPSADEETIVEYGMTPRQLEVCRLLMAGLPNKLIARKLDCAEGTVRLHVSAVLRALNARNRTEAARAALRLGIET